MNLRLKHYNELDGVRAIAVIMVMFYHFFQDINPSDEMLIVIKKLSLFGKTGVSLFFVLSGFLITRILLNTKENPSYFKSFYLRRILRIFPLYYCFLILYYFILPLFLNRPFGSFSEQIWYWTFLQNFALTFDWKSIGPSHYWSLSVEEHFYLFWPLIIYHCSLKRIKWVILILCIISFLTRILLIKNDFEESQFTLARFDELAIGAFLAVLELENKLISENLKRFFFVFAISIIPLAYISFKNGTYSLLDSSIRYLVLGLFYGSSIAVIISLQSTNRVKKVFQTKFLRFTGKISFGLYVYHPICFIIINTYFNLQNFGLDFMLSFSFAYLVSFISYQLFEKKFIKMKSKFDY
ncbi:acyltransferase family protein [Epilithonimonas sp. UC225_85]|uniref:acyltransferase family protein n=1 Tax=Epilithonimonas sp. UC225_85 TaxID=3350167 RepID=UPI0036D2603C